MLVDSLSETVHKILHVFGNNAMGVTQIKEWFNRFKNDRTSGATGAKQNQGVALLFDIRGIVQHKYAPEGQTMNKKSTVNKFSVDSMLHFCPKDQTSGQQKTGSCIMAMLQHIHCT